MGDGHPADKNPRTNLPHKDVYGRCKRPWRLRRLSNCGILTMVLSSLLSRSSRAICNPLVTSTRRVGVYGGRSLAARRIDTHSINAIPQVGMQRTFWDWRGSGRRDDKGDDEKGKGSGNGDGGRGRDGEGRSQGEMRASAVDRGLGGC